MAVYRRGDVWWYKFRFAGQMIRESAKTGSKTVAREAERQRRRELEAGYNNLQDKRDQRVRTISQVAAEFLEQYRLKTPKSAVFAEYAIGHLSEHLGKRMMVDLDEDAVKAYQTARLKEKASPKTINEEVGFCFGSRVIKATRSECDSGGPNRSSSKPGLPSARRSPKIKSRL